MLGHGGDAIQMLELAAGVQQRGLATQLVVPHNDTTALLEQRAQARCVDIERTPLLRVEGNGSRPSVISLVRLFSEYRGSLLHLHTGDICLPRRALAALRLLRRRGALVTIHGSYPTMLPGDLRARQWAFAASRQFSRVVCPSDHSRETQIAFGLPPEQVLTIRNCVDVAACAKGNRVIVRTSLGLHDDDRLIVFSSRLEGGKRPMDALQAFCSVAPTYRNAHLAFVGCGSLEGELKSSAAKYGIASRVHFPGFQQNIPDWLAASDVWIFPTEGENFSVALLEAMAAGCTILSTHSRGNDEVLVDGQNALTTAVGDVHAMTAKLGYLLDTPTESRRLGHAAKRSAARYDVGAMADEYLRAYNIVLDSRARIRAAA